MQPILVNLIHNLDYICRQNALLLIFYQAKKDGVLYVGVTSNLAQRTRLHKNHQIDGFCKRYNVDILVYYELHSSMYQAITREKQLKHWKRD